MRNGQVRAQRQRTLGFGKGAMMIAAQLVARGSEASFRRDAGEGASALRSAFGTIAHL